MKKLFCLVLLAVATATITFAQETKTQLQTRFDVIRNETVAGANTKTRIANAYQELADGTLGVYPITATGTNAYTSTHLGLDAYAGRIIFIKFSNANTDSATININSLGVVEIQKDDGGGSWVDLESGDIIPNKLYRIYHDGARFEIDLGGSGAGLEDMDYGDITVSSDGTIMTIDNLAVTNAKINDVAIGKITGFGTGVGTFLGTPSSANLASALTDEAGSSGGFTRADYVDAKVADAINSGTTTIAPSQDATFKAISLLETSDQTNNYTLALTDAFRTVPVNAATSKTITVPANGTVAFAVGTKIGIKWQTGAAGQPAIAAAATVTINTTSGNLLIPAVNVTVYLVKTATNTWTLMNGVALVTGSITKTDDTNVTLTLGGTPTNSTLHDVSFTLGWTGQTSVARGGTGVDNTTITYTPTLTNSANISASTASVLQYYRIGNMVTVAGVVTIDPITTTTLTTLGMTLPVASNFTTAVDGGGTGAAQTVADGALSIFTDATNDRMTLQYICTDVTNHAFSIHFTYQVK